MFAQVRARRAGTYFDTCCLGLSPPFGWELDPIHTKESVRLSSPGQVKRFRGDEVHFPVFFVADFEAACADLWKLFSQISIVIPTNMPSTY